MVRKSSPSIEIVPGTDVEVYKRTEGRKAELVSVIITTLGLNRISLWDGSSAEGRRKLDIVVPDNTTRVLSGDEVKGISFEYGNIIARGTAPGSYIVVIVDEY